VKRKSKSKSREEIQAAKTYLINDGHNGVDFLEALLQIGMVRVVFTSVFDDFTKKKRISANTLNRFNKKAR
jgi:hypothetical protein